MAKPEDVPDARPDPNPGGRSKQRREGVVACPHCGREIEPDSSRCPHCGADLAEDLSTRT